MAGAETYVIVGANLAGGRAAEALRARGFAGRIVLVGEEPDRPYERPPLSKGYLQGAYPEEKLFLRPQSYYDEYAIELRLGVRATGLEPAERSVALASGERLRYDKLLIATGTQARRLDVPGGDLEGVYALRTLRDARRLAAALQQAQRVVVVGAGFIGLEVAASARVRGCAVTVLEAAAVPLAHAVGAELGQVCAAIHRDHGVDLRVSCAVQGFRGSERVEQVVLADSTAIACDIVVVGVGVTPAVAWLAGSGIALENGVLVNEYTETSLPDVYAAGDVANWWHPRWGQRLRVEHYDNAQHQGLAAARTMLGEREPYAPVPYFWSDQYDLTLQYVGYAPGSDRMVVRGSVAARSFTAFSLRGDRVRAAFSLGRPRELMAARQLIRAQKPVDAAVLADEGVELRTLAR
ncbi:MAG: FAD-dependent oxidoreductase [Chloroflexi bacterium]|nr:FAD-dependent oxidoreductase [Chloroflexota bacterium]